ncbi:MAG: GPW/gp25 family protein [Cyanobacteria bacterium P01_E01_bin.6]
MTTASPFPVIQNIEDEWYGFNLFGTPGQIATNLDHIDQAIKVILTTPFNSVPHHPDWFNDLNELIDKPVNTVRSRLIEGITRSIQRHEPRVDIKQITVAPVSQSELEKLRITVRWQVKESELESTTTVEV